MIGPLAGTVAAVIETNRDDLGGMSSDHHKATSHSARRHQADQIRIGLDKTGFLHRECTHNFRLCSKSPRG